MEKKIGGKIAVYMSPFIADSFSYVAWLHCYNYNIIPLVVPRNIYESATTLRKGIFCKVEKKWNAKCKKMRVFLMFHVLQEVK